MKKVLTSPWTIAIVSAFLAPIATLIIDAIMKKPLLSTLIEVLKTILKLVVSFLTFDIKVWWIIVSIVVIVLSLSLYAKVLDSKENKTAFLEYTEDIFEQWKWSWDWEKRSYDANWHINNLKAHCPKCDTPMFPNINGTVFSCPRCGSRNCMTKHKQLYEIEAVILDNLRRKNL